MVKGAVTVSFCCNKARSLTNDIFLRLKTKTPQAGLSLRCFSGNNFKEQKAHFALRRPPTQLAQGFTQESHQGAPGAAIGHAVVALCIAPHRKGMVYAAVDFHGKVNVGLV